MKMVQLNEYVSLRQGLAINAATNHLVSNCKTGEFVYPLLRIADMVSEKFSKFISKEVGTSVIANKADIIYTRTGQIGLTFTGQSGVVHNNSFIVDVINDNINKDYLFTILQSDFVRNQATTLAKNSVQPDLTHDMFKSMRIPLPNKKTQHEIAKIYSILSKKCELNCKINDNLQQQLKLMYDYWFTQFDFPNEDGKPYRASGGAMVWNESLQREVPVGWKCRTLGDLLTKNATPFDYQTTEPTIDLSVMPTSSISLDKLNSSDAFSTNLFVMTEGDIMFGSIRPYLKKAGIAPCNGVFAGTIQSYSVKKDSDYNFALFTLCRDAFFDYAVQVSSGTKMPVISTENLLEYKVAYSANIAEQFNAIDVRNIICKNAQEIQQLTKLRDWLLPMLMNGQATIAD